MRSKTFLLLFGVSLAILTLDVSAHCSKCVYTRSVTYEVVPACGACNACGSSCMYVEEYEYYNSPIRKSQHGAGEMAEYRWVP